MITFYIISVVVCLIVGFTAAQSDHSKGYTIMLNEVIAAIVVAFIPIINIGIYGYAVFAIVRDQNIVLLKGKGRK